MRPLTVPASWVYGRIIERRNERFDRGAGVRRLPRPVVSVGNLAVGGTGKTPMVAWLARHLVERGLRPCIAMRGYGARPGEMSDEQAEYADRLPQVPVVASPRRYEAVSAFLAAHPDIDGVLLDDGFQHRRVRRDLDIVLLDARSASLEDELLPAGLLRERPAGLRRADAVVITHADAVDEALAGRVRRIAGDAPLAWARHRWVDLEVHAGGTSRSDTAWLSGRRVVTLLGIARPEGVRRQLEAAGAEIAGDIAVRDHQRYGPALVREVRARSRDADAVVCTAKDWVKLRGLVDRESWPCPVVVPHLALDVFDGAATLRDRVLDVFRGDGDRSL